jgi:hypothetical protein
MHAQAQAVDLARRPDTVGRQWVPLVPVAAPLSAHKQGTMSVVATRNASNRAAARARASLMTDFSLVDGLDGRQDERRISRPWFATDVNGDWPPDLQPRARATRSA